MQKKRLFLGGIIAVAASLVLMAGCDSSGNNDTQSANGNNETVQDDGNGSDNAVVQASGFGEGEFSHSEGLDENGFWIGVRALDYVDLDGLSNLVIPAAVHQVSDDFVQSEVQGLLQFFTGTKEVMDRAVVAGDTVNIDFVGSIDGVEFDGGNTQGHGMNVTAGSREFIGDFLDQIIGGMPGDVINVEVDFPEDYHVPELAGEPALFVTTINFIAEPDEPELTDAFVLENLYEFNGWRTIGDMEEGIADHFRTEAVMGYIMEFLAEEVAVSSIPDVVMGHQRNSLIANFREAAEQNGMSFEDFVTMVSEGATNEEELLAMHEEELRSEAEFALVMQAIAEDAGLMVNTEDLAEHFMNFTGSEDYSMFEEMYGLPFLKRVVLSEVVMMHLRDSATLQ